MTDTILAKLVRGGEIQYYGAPAWIVVKAQLYQLSGNNAPYFSVTADIYKSKAYVGARNDRGWLAGGCLHKEILKFAPDLAPVVALHLADDNGAPMHAEANGWYWISGALGGLGERYHGGNREPYGQPNDCRQIFAEHIHIDRAAADSIIDRVEHAFNQACSEGADVPIARGLAREVWCCEINYLRPIWKKQADAAVAILKGQQNAETV